MPLITHRGADGLAPANSIAAIEHGNTYNPLAIEIDVNCTQDYRLIVVHGPITQERSGGLLEKSYDELREDFSNPDLKDVLQLRLRSPYLLDIKTKDLKALELIAEEIKKSPATIYAFTSPHKAALLYVKEAFPKVRTYITQPYHHSLFHTIEQAHSLGFDGVVLNRWWFGPLTYLMCKKFKLDMSVYTIDSKKHIQIIKKYFPSVNIITNRPDLY